jgi:hypothetical protein
MANKKIAKERPAEERKGIYNFQKISVELDFFENKDNRTFIRLI